MTSTQLLHEEPHGATSAAKRPVVILSMEPWGGMWFSKQHYAATLARDREVLFVSLPDRWRLSDLFACRAAAQRTPEGIAVARYRNNLPVRLLERRLGRWMARVNARRIARIAPPGSLVWAFYPSALAMRLAELIPGSRLIYHVVDPLHDQPDDAAMAEAAHLVVAINPWYEQRYRGMSRRVIGIPHGIRPEDRLHDAARVEGFRERYGRFALLASTLSASVNFALLVDAARAFPRLAFVIAGQAVAMPPAARRLHDELLGLPNVHRAGVLPPEELRDLVKAAAVGLVAYDFEPGRAAPAGPGRTPLKALTYLAQLVPAVSTINSYVPAIEGRGFYKAEDADQFKALLRRAIEGTLSVDAAAVNAYLDSVEYHRLIERITRAAEG